MTNLNAFFPERRKGWALGLHAGGGNTRAATGRGGGWPAR